MKIRSLAFCKKRNNRISTDHPDYYLIEVKPDKWQTPDGDKNLSLDAAKGALQSEFDSAAKRLEVEYFIKRAKYWFDETVEKESVPEATEEPTVAPEAAYPEAV